MSFLSFFFNDPPTTEIYTLSLHDALPILFPARYNVSAFQLRRQGWFMPRITSRRIYPTLLWAFVVALILDRKSTRLNSSHTVISYAVFCLKKKKKKKESSSTRRNRCTPRV